jgi:hypothetical protein
MRLTEAAIMGVASRAPCWCRATLGTTMTGGGVAPAHRSHHRHRRRRSRQSHRRTQPRRAACWRWRSSSRRTRPGSAYPSSSRLQSGLGGGSGLLASRSDTNPHWPPRCRCGGARPLGGLEHQAGAASRATERPSAPDAQPRPTSPAATRQYPSLPAEARRLVTTSAGPGRIRRPTTQR